MKYFAFTLVFFLALHVATVSVLSSPGDLDITFMQSSTGLNEVVTCMAKQTDGKIIVGGYFSTYNSVVTVGNICRLNADGSLDNTFYSGPTGFDDGVRSIALQSDGKIIAAGGFTTFNGVACSRGIVRLNTDGTLDNTFNPGGSGSSFSVDAVYVFPSDKILIGGSFEMYNGVSCPENFIRLNSDGTIDNTFNTGGSGAHGSPRSITVLGNSKILISGIIYTYNGVDCPNGIIRINADGTYDDTFNTGGTGTGINTSDGSGSNLTYCIAVASDGKIYLGGVFGSYNGTDCPDDLIRLNSDGSLDATFNPGGTGLSTPASGSEVWTIYLDNAENVLIGGFFDTYNGSPCQFGMARFTSAGAYDVLFNSGGSGFNNEATSFLPVSGNKILVSGYFSAYNGVDIPGMIARLSYTGLPSVNSTLAGNITQTGANFTVNLTNNGGLVVTEYGVCFNTTGAPTTDDSKKSITGSFTTGSFLAELTGLTQGTKYYLRAFATNDAGTAYGTEYTFTTIPTLGEWGLIAFASLIAIIGGVAVWRKF